jgi:hypothetical protein
VTVTDDIGPGAVSNFAGWPSCFHLRIFWLVILRRRDPKVKIRGKGTTPTSRCITQLKTNDAKTNAKLRLQTARIKAALFATYLPAPPTSAQFLKLLRSNLVIRSTMDQSFSYLAKYNVLGQSPNDAGKVAYFLIAVAGFRARGRTPMWRTLIRTDRHGGKTKTKRLWKAWTFRKDVESRFLCALSVSRLLWAQKMTEQLEMSRLSS